MTLSSMIIVISSIIAALTTLIGVALGARLTERQQQAQRRAEFIEHQLRDFYSPLLSLREQILAKTRLREKILKVASEDPLYSTGGVASRAVSGRQLDDRAAGGGEGGVLLRGTVPSCGLHRDKPRDG